MRNAANEIRRQTYLSLSARFSPAELGELYEKITTAVYTALLRPGDTAIDCGAHRGRHTIPMARAVGASGRVIAFEPSPLVLPILKTELNASGCGGWITLHEIAVAAVEGRTEFKVLHGALGMSGIKQRRLTEEMQDRVKVESIEVPVRTLDSVLPNETKVSFIKLDLEGGEFDALRGGAHLLQRNKPVLMFENGRQESAEDYGYRSDDFFRFFENLDYLLFDAIGFPFTSEFWVFGSVPWQYIGIPRGSETDPIIMKAIDDLLLKYQVKI